MSSGAAADKRVCIVNTSTAMVALACGHGVKDSGGIEFQLTVTARALVQAGWQVEFVLCDLDQGDLALDGQARVVRSYRPRGGDEGGGGLRSIPQLWKALRRTTSPVLLQEGAAWMTGVVGLFARTHGRRFVFHMASDTDALVMDRRRTRVSSLRERLLCHWGMRMAHGIIAQTPKQQGMLKESTGRDSAVVPNLFPVGETQTSPPGEPSRVLWVGNLRPVKRPEWLLEAAARLPHLEFCMIGGCKPEFEALYRDVEARAAALPNVSFLGHVPFDQIDQYFRGAALLVCTSQVEGMPNVFLQAWSHGAPVVTTYDPDGLVERHGLGLCAGDTVALADAIGQLMDDPALRAEMGERGRSYLLSHHSPAVVVPLLEHVLLGER